MRLSQAGYMRSILIGGFIVLIALIGSIIWLSYNMFTPPAPRPAVSQDAVRAKIPPPPAPKKIEPPQKAAPSLSEPQPQVLEPEAGALAIERERLKCPQPNNLFR